jgi:hypothetical protein
MPIDQSYMEVGEHIIIAGLFIQIGFFGAFIIFAGIFHWRMLRHQTLATRDPNIRWQAYLTVLYVSGILIWVRSLFRAIEYIDGNNGALMRSEVFVFTLDGLLMLIVMLYMNWFHPRCVPLWSNRALLCSSIVEHANGCWCSEIGLLLKGQAPIKNGFELLFPKSKFRGSHGASESLSSANEMMNTSK